MRSAVIVFPGSNCDRDLATAFRNAGGTEPAMVWHKETELPAGLDVIGIPGGFSYGDYLRCGAIAARAPIMRAVADFAARGGCIIGICNGFQVLIEAGLLPGALMRNAGLKFICRNQHLRVETRASPFTQGYAEGQVIRLPIAHHDGNYIADADTLARLEGEGRVALRYCDASGAVTAEANPNGSMHNIAGILSENRRILGLMPHPERAADPALGGTDGQAMFEALAQLSAAPAG
ncbi:MAG: phosphoribosylformylglycinamidine synthase subunit PurQ [Alphaproteobacteria bacterium]|nr:MAG: phosphoribosylformylglycinamidine synthase subunit PurQ [Alphaproteobacteria bacterium]